MYTWRNTRTTKDFRELENTRDLASYAIQSQYSASEKILALCAGFQERIDPHFDVDLFYRKMFDIYTAEGAGLDNWGVILQMPRAIPGPFLGDCFGFDLSGCHPFDQYPFVPDSSTTNPDAFLITLDDEHYRLLLLYKAMANISASDAATQNKLLSILIDSGIGDMPSAGYVLQVDTMVIRWVFEDFLDSMQQAIFKAVGTLARGAGVGWELYAIDPRMTFGFDGSAMQPFNQAVFVPDFAMITPS